VTKGGPLVSGGNTTRDKRGILRGKLIFLFSFLIYFILFALNIKKFIIQNICVMQNYIMLTQKNTYFSMHILFQELKQILLFFVYNLKGK
jgi:hypothetical protein